MGGLSSPAAQEIEFCLSCWGRVFENMSHPPRSSATGQQEINASDGALRKEAGFLWRGAQRAGRAGLELSLPLCCCSLRCLLHFSSSAQSSQSPDPDSRSPSFTRNNLVNQSGSRSNTEMDTPSYFRHQRTCHRRMRRRFGLSKTHAET